jgi:hypothetical protein
LGCNAGRDVEIRTAMVEIRTATVAWVSLHKTLVHTPALHGYCTPIHARTHVETPSQILPVLSWFLHGSGIGRRGQAWPRRGRYVLRGSGRRGQADRQHRGCGPLPAIRCSKTAREASRNSASAIRVCRGTLALALWALAALTSGLMQDPHAMEQHLVVMGARDRDCELLGFLRGPRIPVAVGPYLVCNFFSKKHCSTFYLYLTNFV